MTIFQGLKSWKSSRGLDKQSYNHSNEVRKAIEEVFELIGYNETEVLVDDFMKQYYLQNLEPVMEDKLDAHLDLIIFSINAVSSLGYIPELALKETYKHIAARKQDPAQAIEWEATGPVGKWQKDKSQDPATLYQPNYKLCKRTK